MCPALCQRNLLRANANANEPPIWQQDGARAHTAVVTREVLEDIFGMENVISQGFPFQWPARSPDITPCDFFMWGYLKDLVCHKSPRPATLEALMDVITRNARAITQEQLNASVSHVLKRAQLVMDQGGGHIEHLM